MPLMNFKRMCSFVRALRILPDCFIEVTTIVGCPVACRYCPQTIFLSKYNSVPNRKRKMELDDFKKIVDSAPRKTAFSFAGFAEPFANDHCTDMIEYTLKRFPVYVFTTLIGMSTRDYDRLRDHENLMRFEIHLPDREGATRLRIDDQYLRVLSYVIKNPVRGIHLSLHGTAEHPAISDLVKVKNKTFIHDRAGNLLNETFTKPDFQGAKIRCSHFWLQNLRYGAGLILPDGTTLVCCNDWSMQYEIGNALVSSIPEMRKSKNFGICVKSCNDPRIQSICRRCAVAVPLNSIELKSLALYNNLRMHLQGL